MTLAELWSIFRARKELFLAIIIVICTAVLLVTLFMPKTYMAESSLVIDTKSTDPVTGNNTAPGELSATVLATETAIIVSHNVALKVVDRLKLASDPSYKKRFSSATDGKGSIRDWIADNLAPNVIVKTAHDANVINIQYPAHDPELSAQITNAFADAYMQTSLELKADPARRQSQWFEQETAELRQRVDAAQKKLADEQSKTRIVGTADHLDVDNAKLTEISTQLVTAQQALYESRTRLHQMNDALAKNKLSALPDVLGNPLLQTLKTDLARAEGNLADVSSRYDRNHPQFRSAKAAVDSLRNKLATEVEAVRGSIEQTAQISQRQVNELQGALDAQKGTLLNAERAHDALDVLSREVDSAQRAYDAGMQRATQVRLSSKLDQSSVAVLNPATAPFQAARPKPLLYLAIAFIFGTLLSGAICVLAEILEPRVRSGVTIAARTGLTVLAEVPRLAVSKKLGFS